MGLNKKRHDLGLEGLKNLVQLKKLCGLKRENGPVHCSGSSMKIENSRLL